MLQSACELAQSGKYICSCTVNKHICRHAPCTQPHTNNYRWSRAVSMVSLFKIKMNPVILCWCLRQSLFASFHGCPYFCLTVKDTKRTYTTEMTDQTGCHKCETFSLHQYSPKTFTASSWQWPVNTRNPVVIRSDFFFHFTLNNCQQNALRVPIYRNQRLGYHFFF